MSSNKNETASKLKNVDNVSNGDRRKNQATEQLGGRGYVLVDHWKEEFLDWPTIKPQSYDRNDQGDSVGKNTGKKTSSDPNGPCTGKLEETK